MDPSTLLTTAPQADPGRVPALAIAAQCATCGAARSGPFCGQCGQQAREGRLSVRAMVWQAAMSVVDLDRGFLHTAVGLFRDPGRVVRDYVAGRTVSYTNPVRYFVMLLAALVLVFVRLDYATISLGSHLDLPDASRVNAWISAHMNLFMAATVPFSALGSLWVFRRAGLNYAEHLVFNLYVYAQQSVCFVVLGVAGWAVGLKGAAMIAYSLASLAYYVWAARSTFGLGWGAATLRTLLLQLGSAAAGGLIGWSAAELWMR